MRPLVPARGDGIRESRSVGLAGRARECSGGHGRYPLSRLRRHSPTHSLVILRTLTGS